MSEEKNNKNALKDFVEREIEEVKNKIVQKCKELEESCEDVSLNYNIKTGKQEKKAVATP